jgi:hypothetical protein
MNESISEQIPVSLRNAKSPMKKSAMIGILIAVLIVAGGGGFFSGMKYEKQKLTNDPSQLFSAARSGSINGNRQFPGGSNSNRSMRNGFGGGIRGTIASISGTSMTVSLTDGSSKIVIVPSSATISKSTTGTSADLTTGQTVMVTGTTNSDGSTTATSVQLNPVTPTDMPPTDTLPTETSTSS